MAIVKTTSKEGKAKIRRHMLSYWSAKEHGTKTNFEALKEQADHSNCGRNGWHSDYNKAIYLVEGGCFLIYEPDIKKWLGNFYTKQQLERFGKQYDYYMTLYAHLIGREYEAMCREQKTAKPSARKKTKRTTKKKSVLGLFK